MSELEQAFVRKHQALHALAKETAELRKTLVQEYVALHYPDVECEVTIEQDNTLALDIVFPGVERSRSMPIATEVVAYLQGLLKGEQ